MINKLKYRAEIVSLGHADDDNSVPTHVLINFLSKVKELFFFFLKTRISTSSKNRDTATIIYIVYYMPENKKMNIHDILRPVYVDKRNQLRIPISHI